MIGSTLALSDFAAAQMFVVPDLCLSDLSRLSHSLVHSSHLSLHEGMNGGTMIVLFLASLFSSSTRFELLKAPLGVLTEKPS